MTSNDVRTKSYQACVMIYAWSCWKIINEFGNTDNQSFGEVLSKSHKIVNPIRKLMLKNKA